MMISMRSMSTPKVIAKPALASARLKPQTPEGMLDVSVVVVDSGGSCCPNALMVNSG
ncbi:hypothetical protein D3C80_2191950 [compost metagenome]